MLAYQLFIIFGRKVRDKDYGPSYPQNCPHCDNEVYFHAYKWRSWFHIFWIPLIPWRAHRELVCPICQSRIDLEKSAFKVAKELVEDTQQYRERRLPKQEYFQSVQNFETSASFIDDPMDLEEFEEEEVMEPEFDDQEAEHVSNE